MYVYTGATYELQVSGYTASQVRYYSGNKERATIGSVSGELTPLTPGNSTDVIRYYSEDTTIATVELRTGEVTGVCKGTVTITAYAMAGSECNKNTVTNRKERIEPTKWQASGGVSRLQAAEKTDIWQHTTDR